MGRVFFTSDTHYGHARVIQYAKRPFASVEEMDETMVARWNEIVSKDDRIYHLGDFAFYPEEKTLQIVRRLNGDKRLVFGNHDKKLRKSAAFLSLFGSTHDLTEIKVPDPAVEHGRQKIVLCHYSLRTWAGMHRGSWALFGHSHGTLPDDPGSLSLDVGVDCWDFRPVSYEQVKERMQRKTFRPVDHHGR